MHQRKTCTNHHRLNTLLLVQETRTCVPEFFDNACYQFYLRHLFHSLSYYQADLHAYVLLPDHFWLLLTARSPLGARALLTSVNRSYGEYFNIRFARRRRPWPVPAGLVPVTGDGAVLTCQKLVEVEPAYSGRVNHAAQWCWSSYRINAFGARHPFIKRHPAVAKYFRQLGDPGHHYRAYINAGFDRGQYEFLRGRITRNQALAGTSTSFGMANELVRRARVA